MDASVPLELRVDHEEAARASAVDLTFWGRVVRSMLLGSSPSICVVLPLSLASTGRDLTNTNSACVSLSPFASVLLDT